MAEILSIGELLDLGNSAATAGLIPYSALEYSAQVITGISGTAIGGQGGTDSATVSAIASAYAESAASGKLDNSASSTWYPMTGNPSGFLTGVDLSPYAYASSVSAKLDASASSQFAPAGDYQPSGDYAFNSSVSSKLDQSAFTAYTATAAGHTYAGISPVVVDNTANTVSLDATAVHLDSSMTAYTSAGSGFIGVNANMDAFVKTADMSGYIPTSESSKYQGTADMSSYIPTSESSNYYQASNPSSFVTTGEMSSAIASSVSGKLDASAQVVTSTAGIGQYVNKVNGSSISAGTADRATFASFVMTGGTGYVSISAIYNDVTGKLDSSAQVVTSTAGSGNRVNKINGSSIEAAYSDGAYRASFAYSAMVDSISDPPVIVPMSAFLEKTAMYTPSFGYHVFDISSIDGSAIYTGSGVAYTSPSGTMAIDNASGTIDSWNSSLRVDEHVTAESSSPGSSVQVGSSNTAMVWTGTPSAGDIAIFSARYPNTPNSNDYVVKVIGRLAGGSSSLMTELVLPRGVSGPSASASAVIDGSYSGFCMYATGQYNVPGTGKWATSISGIANVVRPGQTASSTSVYENVLKDSTWQSLTAWAASQGWTP